MGTDLFILTNCKLRGNEPTDYFDDILRKLKDLKLKRTFHTNAQGERIQQHGDWTYRTEAAQPENDLPFRVEFEGPFSFEPVLYTNVGVVFSSYRYSALYKLYELNRLDSFRKELFGVITCIGGTEAVYVADNSCDKLSGYLENMAQENVPYEEIKSRMIGDLGEPVTDYSQLQSNLLNYRKITEFVFDDFANLQANKQKNTEAF